ncbi:hypothetical protein HNP36_003337 [Chryseobacterium shigense]|uniref:Uncharacterized protein n=1 Tax=Chryseobacterium shigense TaxID=297244 RepID=A0A841NND4_9FLAO|nr:hypothetical protein [Chryseobacterium shigense]
MLLLYEFFNAKFIIYSVYIKAAKKESTKG